jgi:hypothetical protein
VDASDLSVKMNFGASSSFGASQDFHQVCCFCRYLAFFTTILTDSNQSPANDVSHKYFQIRMLQQSYQIFLTIFQLHFQIWPKWSGLWSQLYFWSGFLLGCLSKLLLKMTWNARETTKCIITVYNVTTSWEGVEKMTVLVHAAGGPSLYKIGPI